MTDPVKPADAKPAAIVPAASPEQAKPVQPPAQAVPPVAAPSKPADVKPEPGTVPLSALHEERTARQQLQAELASLKAQMSNIQSGIQPVVQQQQPQVHDAKAELDKLWDTDPRKAVDQTIMYAFDWKDRIDAGLENQADQLAQKDPDFNVYRGTTMNYVRTLPLNQRGTNGILEAAYFMIKGQNVNTILQNREAELMEKYRRGDMAAGLSTPPGSFSSPAPVSGTSLTEEQMRVAEAMGLSPEGYASQIKLQTPQRGA